MIQGIMVTIIVITLIIAIVALYVVEGEDEGILRSGIGLLIVMFSVVLMAVSHATPKKEQPKYKQEIVYSLKDRKYLPTDTIYTEIK